MYLDGFVLSYWTLVGDVIAICIVCLSFAMQYFMESLQMYSILSAADESEASLHLNTFGL